MAGYRQFYTQFWKDEWVIELPPLKKFLFSYLFTNESSSISGLYKIATKVIINETGLEKEFIEATFREFEQAKRILYRDGVMWVVNMAKYHKNASPKTMKKVEKDVAEIPDCVAKRAYQHFQKTGEYPIDTVSILVSESLNRSSSESENTSSSESEKSPEDEAGHKPQDAEPEQSNLYSLYEQNIGCLTPKIADMLDCAEKDYPIAWFEPAIAEAVKNNARSWAYVEAILKRWMVDGFQSVNKPPARNGGRPGNQRSADPPLPEETEEELAARRAAFRAAKPVPT